MNPEIKEILEYAKYPSLIAGCLALFWRYLLLPSKKFISKIRSNSSEMSSSLPILFAIAQRWPLPSGLPSFLAEYDALVARVAMSHARLYAILDLIPTPIYECDTHGNCTHANKALCDLFEMDHAAMLGTGWLQGIHPDDREKTYDRWMNAIAKRIPYESDYRIRGVESKKVTPSATLAFPLYENGVVISYFGRVSPL